MKRVNEWARAALFKLVAIVVMSGCQVSTSNSAPPLARQTADFQQLIIKFKPNTIACDPDGIAQLSKQVRVRLEHIRPMSGHACVIRQLTDAEHDFSQGQIQLRRHPAVEWVEIDAIMKIS